MKLFCVMYIWQENITYCNIFVFLSHFVLFCFFWLFPSFLNVNNVCATILAPMKLLSAGLEKRETGFVFMEHSWVCVRVCVPDSMCVSVETCRRSREVKVGSNSVMQKENCGRVHLSILAHCLCAYVFARRGYRGDRKAKRDSYHQQAFISEFKKNINNVFPRRVVDLHCKCTRRE